MQGDFENPADIPGCPAGGRRLNTGNHQVRRSIDVNLFHGVVAAGDFTHVVVGIHESGKRNAGGFAGGWPFIKIHCGTGDSGQAGCGDIHAVAQVVFQVHRKAPGIAAAVVFNGNLHTIIAVRTASGSNGPGCEVGEGHLIGSGGGIVFRGALANFVLRIHLGGDIGILAGFIGKHAGPVKGNGGRSTGWQR